MDKFVIVGGFLCFAADVFAIASLATPEWVVMEFAGKSQYIRLKPEFIVKRWLWGWRSICGEISLNLCTKLQRWFPNWYLCEKRKICLVTVYWGKKPLQAKWVGMCCERRGVQQGTCRQRVKLDIVCGKRNQRTKQFRKYVAVVFMLKTWRFFSRK